MSVLAAQNPAGGRDDWRTPAEVLDRVRELAPIGLDPCTAYDNPTGAAIWAVAPGAWPDRAMPLSARIDGLKLFWAANCPRGSLVYCNPPYSRGELAAWAGKCRHESGQGAEVIALLPVDTSTQWWHDSCVPSLADAVCFWRGRLTFVGAPGPASFPSALIYWGSRPNRFADVFVRVGAIWT